MEGEKKFHYYRPGKETPETGREDWADDQKNEKRKENEGWTPLGTRGPKRTTSPAPRATKYGTGNYR